MKFINSIDKIIVNFNLEENLKKQNNVNNKEINQLTNTNMNNQLSKKRIKHEKKKERNIDELKYILRKKYNLKFKYKDIETTEKIFDLFKYSKEQSEEKKLSIWYLNNTFDSFNYKLRKDLRKYLDIHNRFDIKYLKNSSYSRDAAASYANKHYDDYNDDYPDFGDSPYEGGDCANFISQCLYAGGMKWVEKNSNINWAENWWCKYGATDKDGDKKITLTWKTTNGFKNHWKFRAEEYYSNAVLSMKNRWNYWYKELSRGDVIQLADKDGDPWHTLIVCGYSFRDFKLAAHTSNTNSTLFKGFVLKKQMSDNDIILVYKME